MHAVHVVFLKCFKRGNPILKFVRNVPWEFGEIVPDYQLGSTSCALYLRQVINAVIYLTETKLEHACLLGVCEFFDYLTCLY